MEIPEHIFKSNDIRGLLEEVTPEIARAVGEALVMKTRAKTVVIGRDMRETSLELQQAAMDGMVSIGAHVIDIGLCTTSMFNFAVSSQSNVDAGLIVTASHNPPEYNGIKMADKNGRSISGIEILATIVGAGLVPAHAFETRGNIQTKDILLQYIGACLAGVEGDFSETKIVIDYGNGMGAMSLRWLCRRLNLDVVELYAEPDARFPNHEANPAKEETLRDVKAAVLREKADFGVALDGDADRIGFVDNEGNSLRGDQVLALLARDVLEQKPNAKIVTSPNQSWIVPEMIREHRGEALECKIGRKHVVEAMQTQHAALGGEVSSHFFFQEFGGLESVDYALTRVLSAWKKTDLTFANWAADARRYENSGEVNIRVQDRERVLDKLERYISLATKVNRLDGIRCEYDHDWWFIIRPSNTEPLLRLIVEAASPELMMQKRDELVTFIKKTQ